MSKAVVTECKPAESTGVSIVVPAYNEAQGIELTLGQIMDTLQKMEQPGEIIVVDDGSDDETGNVARAAGAKVVRHPINSGYGRSLITGIEIANYDTVVIVDADGTYPIEQLPELLSFFRTGFDMVVGARQGRHYRGSLMKWILRGVFRFLVEFTCGRSIPDINSGFRIFSRRKALAYLPSYATGFSFTTTITLLFMLNNHFVGYLPITYKKRYGKSKVRLLRDTLRSLQIVMTAIAQYNPLKLFLLQIALCLSVNVVLIVGSLCNVENVSYWTNRGITVWNIMNVLMSMAILSLVLVKPRKGNIADVGSE